MNEEEKMQFFGIEESPAEESACSRCGKCCKVIIMPVSYKGDDWDEWYKAHGCIELHGVGLMIPSVCPHLKKAKGSRKQFTDRYYCDIYKDRPLLCRNAYIRAKKGLKAFAPDGCVGL